MERVRRKGSSRSPIDGANIRIILVLEISFDLVYV